MFLAGMILVATLHNLNFLKKFKDGFMRTSRDQIRTERAGIMHRKIIRWAGQNDIFNSKDGPPFWTQQETDVSETYFFPDVPM